MLVSEDMKTNNLSESDELARARFPFERVVNLLVKSSIYEDDLEKTHIDNFKLVSFERRTLKIQVNFAFPSYISVDSVDREQLEIRFVGTWFFVSLDGHQALDENTILEVEIVP